MLYFKGNKNKCFDLKKLYKVNVNVFAARNQEFEVPNVFILKVVILLATIPWTFIIRTKINILQKSKKFQNLNQSKIQQQEELRRQLLVNLEDSSVLMNEILDLEM